MNFKKLSCLVLGALFLMNYSGLAALAINEAPSASKAVQAAPNARPIDLAFVFDGPSDKNQAVLKTFQTTISKSLLPDYKAQFPKELIFTGDWTEEGAVKASNKALASKGKMVISLGYMSSQYLANKKKYK